MAPDGGVVCLSVSRDVAGMAYLRKLTPDLGLEWSCGLLTTSFTPSFTAPSVAPSGTILVGLEENAVCAISPAGSILWEFSTVGPVRGTPSVAPDGSIVFGTGYSNILDTSHWNEFQSQRLYELNPDGTEKWSIEGANFLCDPAINANGDVFVTSGERVVCLNSSGGLRWSYTYWPIWDRWRPTGIAIGPDGTAYVNTLDDIRALGNGTPGAIVGLAGTLRGNHLRLTWKGVGGAGSDRILEYRIYISHTIIGDPSRMTPWEYLATVDGNATSFDYDGAQLYDHFIVKAVNRYGESELTSLYWASGDQNQADDYLVLIVVALVASILVVGFVILRRGCR